MTFPDFGSGDLKVVVDRPVRRAALRGIVLLVCAAAAAGGYWYGRSYGALDQQYRASLESINRANETRLATLKRELIDARLAWEVDSQALAAVREDLTATREARARLEEEVTFFRSLMDPKSVARGLQIARFDALPLASGRYSYHLLLTQIATRRSWLSGKVHIELAGTTAQGPQVLPLTELASVEDYPLAFRFRYFQDLRGELELPAGFAPVDVKIRVVRSGKDPLERSFPWPAERPRNTGAQT
ncbi:MAG: DUF6776 family protein [Pseudomonadota bacterium]